MRSSTTGLFACAAMLLFTGAPALSQVSNLDIPTKLEPTIKPPNNVPTNASNEWLPPSLWIWNHEGYVPPESGPYTEPPLITMEMFKYSYQDTTVGKVWKRQMLGSTQWAVVPTMNRPMGPPSIMTPTFSAFATPGDVVLNALDADDLIFTNRRGGKKIMFGTTHADSGNFNEDRPRMVVDHNGKVGIGTTTPATALHVKFLNPAIRVESTTGRTAELVMKESGGTLLSAIAFNGDMILRNNFQNPGTNMVITNQNQIGAIRFGTGATFNEAQRMVIENNGNVGIGIPHTGSAQTPLHVFSTGLTDLRIETSENYTTSSTPTTRVSFRAGTATNAFQPGFIQAVDDGDFTGALEFYTNGSGSGEKFNYVQAMRAVDGSVGIGNVTPSSARLVVKGASSTPADLALNVINSSSSSLFAVRNDGHIGLGTTTPTSRLTINGLGNGSTATTSGFQVNDATGTPILYVKDDGTVGIGTTSQKTKLGVDGTICAKEVRVLLSGSPCWSDFVFDPEYQLMPLREVEEHIESKRHLPGIPSAAQVETDGVLLGEMQAKLLQKIEELTLYVIDQNKRLERLETENAELRASRPSDATR